MIDAIYQPTINRRGDINNHGHENKHELKNREQHYKKCLI
jgi:hypothetical protein